MAGPNLDEVKKVVISLVNSTPGGIRIERLLSDFRLNEGYDLPFGRFGYRSLQVFLNEELIDRVCVQKQGLNTLIHPIMNEKSGHIVKLAFEQNRAKGVRPSFSSQQTANYQQRTNTSRNGNRSPTMPPLVPYQPIASRTNSRRVHENEQKIIQERLLERQRALLAERQPANFNQNGQKQTRTFEATKSILRQMNQRIEAMKISPATESTGVGNVRAEPQSTASKIFNPSTSAQTPPEQSDDLENIWDDELDNIGPPRMNRSNASSFYGVSDTSISVPSQLSQSSHEKLNLAMLDDSSDETKQSGIKDILDDLSVGDIVPVYVSDVNNPLKFWVHIQQEKYIQQNQNLCKEMQKYYTDNKHSEELKVTDPDEPGAEFFAAYHDGQWQRIELYDVRMGESYRVSFIDYGSRDIINTSSMRRLVKQFWKTPRAAVCCALGNIKPINKTFDAASADTFIDLVDGQKLYAKILHIDSSKSKATVELILNSNKISVNDELIRLRHAVPKLPRANA